MKNTCLLFLGSLLITHSVFADTRERFSTQKHSKYTATKGGGLGAAGPGNVGDFRPVEDPKHEYIKAFNHFVAAQNWSEASRLKAEIWEKFSYVVDFKRILNAKELARIEEYQVKYNEAFKAKDFIATKKLNNEVFSLYGVNLVDPVLEVAVNDSKLTEKDWSIINEAQLTYNKYYAAQKFAEAKSIYSKIYDTYGVYLKAPAPIKLEPVEAFEYKAVEAVKSETIDTSRTRIISGQKELLQLKE